MAVTGGLVITVEKLRVVPPYGLFVGALAVTDLQLTAAVVVLG
jgi:hypothetical protein